MGVLLRSVLLSTVCGLTVVAAAQVSRPPQSPLSITISSSQKVIKAGSGIKLRITMVNTSDQDAFYTAGAHKSVPYEIYVWDTTGKLAPETSYGRRVHPSSPGHPPFGGSYTAFRVRLGPGEKRETEVDVSREYDLRQPGDYTIQAQDKQGSVIVKSNTITVTVTP